VTLAPCKEVLGGDPPHVRFGRLFEPRNIPEKTAKDHLDVARRNHDSVDQVDPPEKRCSSHRFREMFSAWFTCKKRQFRPMTFWIV